MAKLNRAQVVERAYSWYRRCGYQWGGWVANMVTVAGTDLIATDCSGWTSWCWNTPTRHTSGSWSPTGYFGGDNYRRRSAFTGRTIEEDYVGIQPGDVLWRDGHVGLYVGNNTIIQASTAKWANTNVGNGFNIGPDFQFDGFCSFDGSFSADYDPDEDNPIDDNGWDGSEDPPVPTPPGDQSDPGLAYLFADNQYTKRKTRQQLKHYRRFM